MMIGVVELPVNSLMVTITGADGVTRRLPLESGYFEAYNRDTVTLIDDAGQRWRLRVSQLTDTVGLSDAVVRALREDMGTGDVTTLACIPAGASARAAIRARSPMVLSGVALAIELT